MLALRTRWKLFVISSHSTHQSVGQKSNWAAMARAFNAKAIAHLTEAAAAIRAAGQPLATQDAPAAGAV